MKPGIPHQDFAYHADACAIPTTSWPRAAIGLVWPASLRYALDWQLLFVSSADAYGDAGRSGAPIDEEAPLAPRNIYTATKAAVELALGSMVGQGLRVVRLRPFNHTGPKQSPALVISAFARQIVRIATVRQAPLLDVGNLGTWRDFLDVRDVCAVYVACIDRRNTLPSGTIINVGSGHARRIGDVLDDLMALAGVAADVRAEASRTRANAVTHAIINAGRARALLGWEPIVPWSQTLVDVLQDWRARIATAPDGT